LSENLFFCFFNRDDLAWFGEGFESQLHLSAGMGSAQGCLASTALAGPPRNPEANPGAAWGENHSFDRYCILINKKGLNLVGSGLNIKLAAFRQRI